MILLNKKLNIDSNNYYNYYYSSVTRNQGRSARLWSPPSPRWSRNRQEKNFNFCTREEITTTTKATSYNLEKYMSNYEIITSIVIRFLKKCAAILHWRLSASKAESQKHKSRPESRNLRRRRCKVLIVS